MASDGFYKALPVYDDLSCIVNTDRFMDVPADWYVVIADVVDSSSAVERGLYREVNTVGAAVITAVLNITGKTSIPYVFGGDGATLCIPGSLVTQVKAALSATVEMAQRIFGLTLRVGMVPISRVAADGLRLKVARCRMSAYLINAMFIGDGLDHVERIVKAGSDADGCIVVAGNAEYQADFSGLECRWDQIPSRHGETVTLAVKALSGSLDGDAFVYADILESIKDIYGDVSEHHPLHLDGLRLSADSRKLRQEYGIRTYARGIFYRARYWLKLRAQYLIGRLLLDFGLTIFGTNWKRYKPELIENSDYQKLDGVLRMVISGTAQKRRALEAVLDALERAGSIVYGLHVSEAAQITCLVFNHNVEHVHFVDGAGGGYCLASVQLKRKLRNRKRDSK